MKEKVLHILAFFCYYSGIIRLFYYLNRRSKRIVTFHNVIPANLLPNGRKIGLTDTEESFRMKIREIQKHFKISTDIQDSHTLTITFDDGYCNEYEIVHKLVSDDVKGVIFASGHIINNSVPSNALIVDLLMHWTELIPNGKYFVNYPTMVLNSFEATTSNRQWLWQKVIYPSYVADSFSKGHGLLRAIDKSYSIDWVLGKCAPDYLRLRLTGLSSSDIDHIRQDGWIVGWHCKEHFPLSALTPIQKKHEIDDDAPKEMKRFVLSYPYGDISSVDARCIKITEQAGYPCAVSNILASNSLTGRYFLPRITLSDDKYLLHFELSGVKFFLQSGKLLPKC